MITTVGRLMVSEALPEGLNEIDEPLSVDALDERLEALIQANPEAYSSVAKKLLDLGGAAAMEEGITLRLEDTLHSIPDRDFWIAHVREQQRKIEASDASQAEKEAAIEMLYSTVQQQLVDSNYETALQAGNPFALQVKSRARGNKMQLAQLMATPGMFRDGQGKVIPIFISRSYAEGLKPSEFWAATYGARDAVKSTKFATREAGEVGKKLVSAARALVVTEDDCETLAGIPVTPDDPDNIGSVLARAAAGFPAGTVITRPIMDKLSKEKSILVKSPLTCGLAKGVCKQCTGIRESGHFANIGDYIGVSAGSAIAERVAQGALNVKHCLMAGTQVLMPDLSSKAIEDLVPGDLVYGSDLEGNTRLVVVKEVFDNGFREVWRTTFKHIAQETGAKGSYIELESTLDHKILATSDDSEFYSIPVRQFTYSEEYDIDKLRPCLGISKERHFRKIWQEYIGTFPTYDIEVDHPDHMFVLANGLIVSNSGGQKASSESDDDDDYAGFKFVKQFLEVPQNFSGAATLAHVGGTVDNIVKAPQGGHYVYIGEEEHYVGPDYALRVKVGDRLFEGDRLSAGLVNPSELVKYKGLGEGRFYFTNQLTKLLRNSGWKANRRNVEVLTRALLDTVTLDDTMTDGLGEDTVSYQAFARNYKPRAGSKALPLTQAVGTYLEEPVLHYTIGTKVNDKVANTLKSFGINSVVSHQEAPQFQPTMLSLTKVPMQEPDWIAQLGSSYLETNLLKNVHRGAQSDVKSLNPLPAIAKGVEFGLGN